MSNDMPDELWMQRNHYDGGFDTHCEDKINDDDVRYVKAPAECNSKYGESATIKKQDALDNFRHIYGLALGFISANHPESLSMLKDINEKAELICDHITRNPQDDR